jgi:hypothetical protein
MADSGTDPNALYEYGQTGIPTSFTQNEIGLGYVPTPFAPQEDVFKNQIAFQHVLKSILDAQIGAYGDYGVGTNTAMLPFNLRNLFAGASTVLTDPTYGIIGAPGFFGGGYKMGDLPANRSSAYENWWQAAHGYPNVPAPKPLSSGGGSSGGGGASSQKVGSYTVPLQGGGSMTVNATSAAAAQQNANQGGNKPDTSQPVQTNRAAQGY